MQIVYNLYLFFDGAILLLSLLCTLSKMCSNIKLFFLFSTKTISKHDRKLYGNCKIMNRECTEVAKTM